MKGVRVLDFKINFTPNPWELYQKLDIKLIEHCEKVAQYTYILYKLALNAGLYQGKLSEEQLVHIKNAVIYLDIGKSRISTHILNKRGPLTSAERKGMEKHIAYGEDIFRELLERHYTSKDTLIYLETVLQSISHHHERFDGTGYPGGLKGDEISVVGRMCSLCDFYSRLTTVRPSRAVSSHEEVLAMIQNEWAKAFDPHLVDLFIEYHEAFRQVRTPSLYDDKRSLMTHKKHPERVSCICWKMLPKWVSEDMEIDITGLAPDEAGEHHCIQVSKNKNLLVRADPRKVYSNLSFHLEGGNLLLLQDIHLYGGGHSLITLGDQCWVVSKGDCVL